MDIGLLGDYLGFMLAGIDNGSGAGTAALVGVADQINAHNHLVDLATVGIRVLGNDSRHNLTVGGLALPVVTQEIFLVENVVIVRGQLHAADGENRFREVVGCVLVVAHGNVCEGGMGSESALCDHCIDLLRCHAHRLFPPYAF